MAAARPTTIDDLRRYAVLRSLFTVDTVGDAIERLGFLQADPIRAPARAQDLTLRQRVTGYRAGDLERLYATLAIEEEFFVNYGFVSRRVSQLLHPRTGVVPWTAAQGRRVRTLLAFVRERGTVHPRDVDREFSHGPVVNYWGGTSNLSTHLLNLMHYSGLLRVVARERGIRQYGVREIVSGIATSPTGPARGASRAAALDALVDVVVEKYAPVPAATLTMLIRRLRYGVPHWKGHLTATIARARQRLSQVSIDGVQWFWPASDDPRAARDVEPAVRLLAPFDPIVWDRRRFELFWGWPYRFEAYTPRAKRLYGYYALPLLWGDQVIGWSNVTAKGTTVTVDAGYLRGRPPRERAFARAFDEEIERLRQFLAADDESEDVGGSAAISPATSVASANPADGSTPSVARRRPRRGSPPQRSRR